VLAAVVSALEGRRAERRYPWAIATGVLVGIASLTRTNGLLLLLPFALAFAPTHSRRRPRSWGLSAVVLLAACLTIAPWTVRNWTVFHSFIPISDESGYTLAGTYNQVSRANHKAPALWIEAEHGASPEYARILRTARAKRWNEPTYGNHLQAQALDELGSHPGYVLQVGFWNTVRMLDLGDVHFAVHNLHDTGIPLAPALLVINSSPLLLVLAFGGLLTRSARRAPKWLWLVPVCLWTSVFVTGFIRFRAPIDPFLVLLAAVALVDVFDQFSGRRSVTSRTGRVS
jgi:4-amino-4-deoxy-L-arabinose transferase-like glycosyltransferase